MDRWHSLPAEVYALVEHTPATVLLETSKPGAQPCVSRLFIAPLSVIEARKPADLPDLFAQIEDATRSGYFAAGLFSYECGQVFEPKVAREPGSADCLLAWIGIYERSYCFDHAAGTFLDGEPPGMANATVSQPVVTSARSGLEAGPIQVTPTITENEYADRIHDIHEWIRAGDVYQINFAFPLEMRISEPLAELYARLRDRQPVEYGAFVHCDAGHHILCFSPELFFHVEKRGASRYILAKPMKGTARRGRTTAEDAQVADWLRNDLKNRSENVMIVDLIRNDLGRLCEFGSVQVESLFEVERFPTLWQMTSTVSGELRSSVGFHEIFRALFPCGSITGAPKIRAMQLIAEKEGTQRGSYAGALGYFSYDGNLDSCITLRTALVKNGQVHIQAGAGVVADSVPAARARVQQHAGHRAQEPVYRLGIPADRFDRSIRHRCSASGYRPIRRGGERLRRVEQLHLRVEHRSFAPWGLRCAVRFRWGRRNHIQDRPAPWSLRVPGPARGARTEFTGRAGPKSRGRRCGPGPVRSRKSGRERDSHTGRVRRSKPGGYLCDHKEAGGERHQDGKHRVPVPDL